MKKMLIVIIVLNSIVSADMFSLSSKGIKKNNVLVSNKVKTKKILSTCIDNFEIQNYSKLSSNFIEVCVLNYEINKLFAKLDI